MGDIYIAEAWNTSASFYLQKKVQEQFLEFLSNDLNIICIGLCCVGVWAGEIIVCI